MDRLRDALDGLPAWQRGILAGLSAAVALMSVAVLAVAVGRGPGDDPVVTTPGPTATVPTSTTPGPATTTSSAGTSTGVSSTSTTTATSTTTLRTTTTTTPPDLSALDLRPDGIGPLAFGADAERSVERIEGFLGPADEDTGWVDVEAYGACIGSTVRFVRWRSLQIFLTDGPSDWAPAGVRHLAAYVNARELADPALDLRTADGIRVGLPVGDLRSILDDGEIVGDEALGAAFAIDPPGPGILWGLLSGLDATDVVESVAGGFSCGE